MVDGDSTFRDKSITNQNVSSWPMIGKTWDSPEHNQSFSYSQTIKILTGFTGSQDDTH